MLWPRVGTAFCNWPRRKASETSGTIIHHDRACHGDVDAERGRDFDGIIAAFDQFIAQRAALGAQNVGRARRMPETWQIHRFIQQLHTDEPAVQRKLHFSNIRPVVNRKMPRGLRRVGLCLEGPAVGVDGECEAGTKPMRRANQIAEIHRL